MSPQIRSFQASKVISATVTRHNSSGSVQSAQFLSELDASTDDGQESEYTSVPDTPVPKPTANREKSYDQIRAELRNELRDELIAEARAAVVQEIDERKHHKTRNVSRHGSSSNQPEYSPSIYSATSDKSCNEPNKNDRASPQQSEAGHAGPGPSLFWKIVIGLFCMTLLYALIVEDPQPVLYVPAALLVLFICKLLWEGCRTIFPLLWNGYMKIFELLWRVCGNICTFYAGSFMLTMKFFSWSMVAAGLFMLWSIGWIVWVPVLGWFIAGVYWTIVVSIVLVAAMPVFFLSPFLWHRVDGKMEREKEVVYVLREDVRRSIRGSR